MADDIPEWAFGRAESLRRSGEFIGTTFARYIEQHEQPPESLLIEARKLASQANPVTPNWNAEIADGKHDSGWVVNLALAALRRGLTITASDASASVQSPGCVDAAPGRKG